MPIQAGRAGEARQVVHGTRGAAHLHAPPPSERPRPCEMPRSRRGCEMHLVGPDLLEWLPLADHVELPLSVQHELGTLGEGVVVFGAHRRAICAGALDDDKVADGGIGAQMAASDGLGRIGCGRQQVAALAAVADHHVLAARSRRPRLPLGVLDEHKRVLRAVQRRPEHFGHSGIQLQEGVALRAGGGDVLHGRYQGSRIGDQECTRLNLEGELAAGAAGKRLERLLDWDADDAELGGLLRRHAAHLVPAAQVEHLDRRDLLAQAQRESRNPLPHQRIRAGADVRVDSRRLQVILGEQRLDVGHQLVPDAKRRRRSAHVGLAGAARAEARVEAQAELVGAVAPLDLAV
mmetsp:Transcript_5581/g.18582  ORF Transcript_5581/g.18582 Transcript_5581/m.18582 type:complete len:348 (+) Transcript_5581:407-1450(+)